MIKNNLLHILDIDGDVGDTPECEAILCHISDTFAGFVYDDTMLG
jgi:hypothetical protein